MMINCNYLIEISSRHLTGGSEEVQPKGTMTNLSQNAPCPCWDPNRAPPECEYKVLLLHQPARLRMFTVSDTRLTSMSE